MKKEKMLIVSVILMLTFSGCGNGADGYNAVESNVSTNKEETANITDNVPEIESSTSEEETENEIVETSQENSKETVEAVGDVPDETDGIEIIEAEVSDISEIEPADTDSELPSTALCVGTAKEIFELTNAERVTEGLPELVWSDELAEAADIRAEEIITEFSHVRPNGEKCYSLGSNIHGENIARGPHATGKEFVEHWMDSPGHRANILRSEVFIAIGVGVRHTEMGDTAVQIFGTY